MPTRWHSALEAMSDTILGLLIAYALQVVVYGDAATVVRAGGDRLGVWVDEAPALCDSTDLCRT